MSDWKSKKSYRLHDPQFLNSLISFWNLISWRMCFLCIWLTWSAADSAGLCEHVWRPIYISLLALTGVALLRTIYTSRFTPHMLSYVQKIIWKKSEKDKWLVRYHPIDYSCFSWLIFRSCVSPVTQDRNISWWRIVTSSRVFRLKI